MHDALKKVLQAALPRMVGVSVMVADELVESGSGESFTKYLHRMLSARLADFIVESKVLDGADKSCFSMAPDDKLAATRCEARLHVLTPQELEALVTQAFTAGREAGREARYGLKGDWDAPPWASPRFSSEDMERITQLKWWSEAFDTGKKP